jgi:hypothetical protein
MHNPEPIATSTAQPVGRNAYTNSPDLKPNLILTPAWVQNKWREFEALSLQTSDPANIQKRVLPLQLDLCEVPRWLGMLTSADFTDRIHWEREFARVVKAIDDRDS